MAQAAAMQARATELGRELKLESVDRDRRRDPRHVLQLPTTVVAQNGLWRELAGSLDVSKSGIRLSLIHPLKWGAILRVQLPMPQELRAAISQDPIYDVQAIVCHCSQTGSGAYLVGAEFGGIPENPVE